MNVQTVPISPWSRAAFAVLSKNNSSTSFGSTGIMIPNDNMSSSTVTRMKRTVAQRDAVVADLHVRQWQLLRHLCHCAIG